MLRVNNACACINNVMQWNIILTSPYGKRMYEELLDK